MYIYVYLPPSPNILLTKHTPIKLIDKNAHQITRKMHFGVHFGVSASLRLFVCVCLKNGVSLRLCMSEEWCVSSSVYV